MFERTKNRTEPAKVKVGDMMAFVYWARVKAVAHNGLTLLVCDLDDNMTEIQVTGKHLVESSYSADQYQEEHRVSMTQAAELLVSSHNRPFTVCFLKKDGSERTLRGRLIKPEPLLGRSMVEELDVAENRTKQVDHRTIKSLVVDGVKYIVR